MLCALVPGAAGLGGQHRRRSERTAARDRRTAGARLRIIVLPDAPRDLVAAQVEGFKVDAGHLQLLHAGTRGWSQDRERCQHPRTRCRGCWRTGVQERFPQTCSTHKLPLGSSPEAGRRQLRHSHQGPVVPSTSDVGYCVGWCWASRSSFSICISVVFPALSRPWAAGGPVQGV